MKRHDHRLRYIALAFLIATTSACTYSADPIEAWVIDAETKQPLEGVVVTANWQLTGGFEGGYPKGQMMVMETVTDKNGRFYFPGWGPKLHMGEGSLRETQPQLLLFKSGYEYRRLANEVSSKEVYTGKSEWSGKRIGLIPFNGTINEYANHLSSLHTSIRSILDGGRCEWKKMPRLMVALDRQEAIFRHAKIYSPLYSIDDLPDGKCGSPRKVLQEFMR